MKRIEYQIPSPTPIPDLLQHIAWNCKAKSTTPCGWQKAEMKCSIIYRFCNRQMLENVLKSFDCVDDDDDDLRADDIFLKDANTII